MRGGGEVKRERKRRIRGGKEESGPRGGKKEEIDTVEDSLKLVR